MNHLNLKLSISYVIILTTNLLFTLKYLPRYFEYGTLMSYLFLMVQIAFILFLSFRHIPLFVKWFYLVTSAITFIGFTIFTHIWIDLESLNVDRWSGIYSYSERLFSGQYPYFSKTHLGNYSSQFPFYFVLTVPFRLIGELSILSAAGYIIFLMLSVRSKSYNTAYDIPIFLLSTSCCAFWEIAVRSNLFLNSILILLALWEYNRISQPRMDFKFISSAVFSGFILSTRGIFILVYAISFLSNFRVSTLPKKWQFRYIAVAAGAFLLTFIPFLLVYQGDFFVMNPFIVQSSNFIPKSLIAVLIVLSALTSLVIKDQIDQFFYGGILLYVSILAYFLSKVIAQSFNTALYGNGADISYFIFSLPFLLYSIKMIIEKKRKAERN